MVKAPPRRKSPRSATRAEEDICNVQMIEMLDAEEEYAVETNVAKMSNTNKSSKLSVASVAHPGIAQEVVPNPVKERDSLKTNLFPEEVNVEKSPPSKKAKSAQPSQGKKSGAKDASNMAVSGKNIKPAAVNNVTTAKTASTKIAELDVKATESLKATDSTSTEVIPQPLKKKKKKKSFQDELLHLMFMTCKPYTVKCLAQELKGASESAIEFCFLSLVDKGWVVKKSFTSKSRTKDLYWGNQECKNKELMDILGMVPPQQIQQARQELQQLTQHYAQASRELEMVLREPSNEDLNAQLQQSELQVQELERRLKETQERVKGASSQRGIVQTSRPGFRLPRNAVPTKPISSKRMKQKINDMRLQWKKRKEKCMDFVENMSDAMEKKIKEVVTLLQLETDEMVGVTIPKKYDQV